ncbi:MAG: hypothetical protein OEY34_01285 [Cyclobacteriaceae bacterium]|nr:hypothetical protein [Cyclobacteriaceae bacterium]
MKEEKIQQLNKVYFGQILLIILISTPIIFYDITRMVHAMTIVGIVLYSYMFLRYLLYHKYLNLKFFNNGKIEHIHNYNLIYKYSFDKKDCVLIKYLIAGFLPKEKRINLSGIKWHRNKGKLFLFDKNLLIGCLDEKDYRKIQQIASNSTTSTVTL